MTETSPERSLVTYTRGAAMAAPDTSNITHAIRVTSPQRVKISRHVPRISIADMHVRHRRFRIHSRRILDPLNHVVRRVFQDPRDVHPAGDLFERRSHQR